MANHVYTIHTDPSWVMVIISWWNENGDQNMFIIRSDHYPIGSMYGIYTNIWGILMVNVTIYGIHTDPMGT